VRVNSGNTLSLYSADNSTNRLDISVANSTATIGQSTGSLYVHSVGFDWVSDAKGGASVALSNSGETTRSLSLQTSNSKDIFITPAGNTLITSGNLGIGTTSPQAALQVYGAGQLTSALTDSGAQTGTINITGASNSAGAGGALLFSSINNNGTNVPQAAIKSLLTNGAGNGQGDLTISTRNATGDTALTERLRVTSLGSIGIGTSTPGRTLSVVGDIRATGILYDSTNSAGTSGNFLMTTGTGYQWTSTSTLFGSNQVTGSGTNGYVTRWTAANTVSTGVILDNGTVAGVNATSSTIAFNIQGTSSLDPLQVGTSTNTGMFIVKGNSGNVGVGSSNPGAKLDVQSSVSGVTGININSTAAAALAWSGNGTLYGSLSYAAATTTAVRATAGNALALGANGVDGYLNIVPGGNVRISRRVRDGIREDLRRDVHG
jgi:hypothetical protein